MHDTEDPDRQQVNTNLTVFLLRESKLQEFETTLLESLRESSIPLVDPLDGIFIPLPAQNDRAPRWIDEVRTLLAAPLTVRMNAMSPGGLLVIRHAARTFVVTFGHGWQKLQETWLERDFGKRIALNTIPRGSVVEFRAEQVLTNQHLASERAPRASSADRFSVNLDRDLVGSLEGIPKQSLLLGKTLRGSTSLKISRPISKLPDIFDVLLERFTSFDYQGSWPELDNFSPVDDEEVIERLEVQLDLDLADPTVRRRMAMFTPNQRTGESLLADSYVFGRRGLGSASSPYLTIDGWINHLARHKQTPSLETARSTPVHIYEEDAEVPHSVRVIDCLGYEQSAGQTVYVLSSGIWYAVSRNYIRKVNRLLRQIPETPLTLLAWNREDDEGQYNKRCSAECRFLNCDAKNIFYGGGRSQLEFCDMLDPKTNTLVFAKIVSRSSGMSHLTEQVRRTADMLFEIDPEYRSKLRGHLHKLHPAYDTTWLGSRPQNESWNFCLLSLGKRSSELPFFAKCGLANLFRDMTVRGHRLFFAHV